MKRTHEEAIEKFKNDIKESVKRLCEAEIKVPNEYDIIDFITEAGKQDSRIPIPDQLADKLKYLQSRNAIRFLVTMMKLDRMKERDYFEFLEEFFPEEDAHRASVNLAHQESDIKMTIVDLNSLVVSDTCKLVCSNMNEDYSVPGKALAILKKKQDFSKTDTAIAYLMKEFNNDKERATEYVESLIGDRKVFDRFCEQSIQFKDGEQVYYVSSSNKKFKMTFVDRYSTFTLAALESPQTGIICFTSYAHLLKITN